MTDVTNDIEIRPLIRSPDQRTGLFMIGTSVNLFQSSVVFYIETSHLIYTTNQMTGFYLKSNTILKLVKY